MHQNISICESVRDLNAFKVKYRVSPQNVHIPLVIINSNGLDMKRNKHQLNYQLLSVDIFLGHPMYPFKKHTHRKSNKCIVITF